MIHLTLCVLHQAPHNQLENDACSTDDSIYGCSDWKVLDKLYFEIVIYVVINLRYCIVLGDIFC